MNNTKWNEIFELFYFYECSDEYMNLEIPWMTKTVNGYVYGWDSTWTHFGCEPKDYQDLEWLKIKLTPLNREIVINTLKKIHVPGEVNETEAVVYGYRTDVDYI